jgi:lysine 6-dehydrogenase
LPLREADARIVVDGQIKPVPRYSGVEPVTFAGVGECEAYDEGFMPWLLELAALRNLRLGTQKTVRWPGYAAKATILKEMGLLSQTPIQVDGLEVAPKSLLDALLYPHVKLNEGEYDITTFRVEVSGLKAGQRCRWQADMVDWYDRELGFTSMARTTAFTGAIVARMIGRGELARTPGLSHPEQLIAGPHFERLLGELAVVNITFQISGDGYIA